MKKILIIKSKSTNELEDSWQESVIGKFKSGSQVVELNRSPFFLLKFLFLLNKFDRILLFDPFYCRKFFIWINSFFKKKLIVALETNYSWQKNKKRKGINQQVKLCELAEVIIVPNEYMTKTVIGWGIPHNKIILINYELRNRECLSKDEAKKKLNISGNLLLSVGTLMPSGGFRMLIKMMPQFLSVNPFFKLVIIGDGPDKKVLSNMIRNLKLEKKVYLLKNVGYNKLLNYFSASEILIISPVYQKSSQIIIEAMQVGLPIISSPFAGIKELIIQGQNGFLVRHSDEFNMFEAVKTLWHDKELRQEFQEQGRILAEKYNRKIEFLPI